MYVSINTDKTTDYFLKKWISFYFHENKTDI